MKITTLLYLIFLNCMLVYCQNTAPILKANSNKVSVRIGKQYYPQAWIATPKPQNDPEEIGSEIAKEGSLMAFITDKDSLGFMMKQGESRVFKIIINEKDTVWAVAKGTFPKANFDKTYKKANNGKTLVELPTAYELVNIIMAITPTGIRDSNLIEHDIPYYQKVQTYFAPFKNHKAVILIDSLLKANQYFDIKMDSYCYGFEKGILKKKSSYNRIAWGKDNMIDAHIPIIQDFAKKSNFEAFFKQNAPFYTSLIRTFKDTLNITEMQNWLKKNFPSAHYNCTKIIFSPLVGGNQSASDFEDNGFKEMQAHVDYPSFWYNPTKHKYSLEAVNITRGDILFTEMNHPYENPEFETNEQNAALFNNIPFKLEVFEIKGTAAANGYTSPLSCVEEYMNWALVCLRYVDYAPKEDLEALLQMREKFMVERRGFTKFKEFNRFLIDIYTKRSHGKVVADLYPQIIQWFAENNK
ncbi:MAG: DUF4932 domain-containing protein [Saprospiraceae bacterium]|nr:DUF4932 domain-containing protein [Saprospiraceae bacterium]